MFVAVLRLSAADFEPQRFAEEHRLDPGAIWHAGVSDCLGRVHAHSVTPLLDIGIGVGNQEQFTASPTVLPSDLRLLFECSFTLAVSAYPTSDQ
jgi:hypothetical protein